MVRIGHQPCDASEPRAAQQRLMETGHGGKGSAASVAGYRMLHRDYRQSQPYWISPRNVYFSHCPAEK